MSTASLFTPEEAPLRFSLNDQIACVERELRLRRDCYPRWIERGRMSEEVANYELACMEQVLRTLRALINDGK